MRLSTNKHLKQSAAQSSFYKWMKGNVYESEMPHFLSEITSCSPFCYSNRLMLVKILKVLHSRYNERGSRVAIGVEGESNIVFTK